MSLPPRPIRALVLDVDGVLTDGGILLDNAGNETKRFHAHDGVGIRLAQLAGWRVLFLTARNSPPARKRAEELGAEWAMGIKHKPEFLGTWLAEAGIDWQETAMLGDDLQDLSALERVGAPIAVANAVREVREFAMHTTRFGGGNGAVREAVEWLLECEGRHAEILGAFRDSTSGFGLGEAHSGGGA